MNIVPYLLWISLCLVGLSVVFFLFLFQQKNYDHSDRMALAPLKDDDNAKPSITED